MSYEIVSAASSAPTTREGPRGSIPLGVRLDGNLVYALEENPSDSPVVVRVYVGGQSSPSFEFPGDAEFTRSSTRPYFAVARPSNETPAERILRRRQRRALAWTCSVYDANTLEEMDGYVVETEGKPKMTLSASGLTFVVCDRHDQEKTRLRVLRLGVSNEYLKNTCKQCEEPGVNEAFDDYCRDPVSFNPLRKISPLYKTPINRGGDDTCWNTDISKNPMIISHPTTRKNFTVDRLDLPPPSTLRILRESIVSIAFSNIESIESVVLRHPDAEVVLKLKNGATRSV